MIVAMVDDPTKRRSILVIVIQKENLDRMADADPITMESCFHGGMLAIPKYPQDYNILIATEFDEAEVTRRAKSDSPMEFIAWLERGRVFIKGKDGVENARPIRRYTSGEN